MPLSSLPIPQDVKDRSPSTKGKRIKLKLSKTREQKPSSPKPRGKKTILIIEDQEGFRQIFSDILSHGGYAVLEAPDGQKGWELVESLKPELVLLDLMLPGLNGFDLLKKIRLEKATKEIPVVIISVLDEVTDKAKGLELGANDYLVKGCLSSQQILSRINNLLK